MKEKDASQINIYSNTNEKNTPKTTQGEGFKHTQLGNFFLQRMQWSRAWHHYEEAENYLGENPTTRLNKAVALKNMGFEGEAAKLFKQLSKQKDETKILAQCNLANIATDKIARQILKLREPSKYFKVVLEELPQEQFNKIDESRYEVSEAIIKGTNLSESYVFRRAPHHTTTTKIFTTEGEVINTFTKANEKYKLGLNLVKFIGFTPNVKGYDTIVFARSQGKNLLDTFMETSSKSREKIIKKLPRELAKIRYIGQKKLMDKTRQMHTSSAEKNNHVYQERILNKFIGNKNTVSGLHSVTGDALAKEIETSIKKNYEAVTSYFSSLPKDFYKDMSLKNMLYFNEKIEHIDFETLRNVPFVMEVATLTNMGNFIQNKNNFIQQVYLECKELSDAPFGSLEELIFGFHGAGVQRGLIHHASFIDWAYRLERNEYRQLAIDTMENVLEDIAWLKAEDKKNKEKLSRLEEGLVKIYN